MFIRNHTQLQLQLQKLFF